MLNATELRYGFNFELSYGFDAIFMFTSFVDIFCNIPVHLWVIAILTVKPTVLRGDIRHSYMADQITMIIYGFVMCIFLRPYPVFPWPGYHCAGILCQIGLDSRIISASFGTTLSSVVPFFCYLMMRLHNLVSVGTETKYNISGRTQTLIMLVISVLLLANSVCFGFTAVDADNSVVIKQASELALLALRTGTLTVFGSAGEPQSFRYEVALLCFTIFAGIIFLLAITFHSLYLIQSRSRARNLSQKTVVAQDRLTVMFFLQIIAIFVFYVIPMLSWVCLTTIDLSSWPDHQLIALRASITVSLSLKPLVQSLIFLGKNPVLRKLSLIKMKQIFAKMLRIQMRNIGLVPPVNVSTVSRTPVASLHQ